MSEVHLRGLKAKLHKWCVRVSANTGRTRSAEFIPAVKEKSSAFDKGQDKPLYKGEGFINGLLELDNETSHQR